MCVSARCGAATLESGHSPELIAPEGKLSRKPKFHQKPPWGALNKTMGGLRST